MSYKVDLLPPHPWVFPPSMVARHSVSRVHQHGVRLRRGLANSWAGRDSVDSTLGHVPSGTCWVQRHPPGVVSVSQGTTGDTWPRGWSQAAILLHIGPSGRRLHPPSPTTLTTECRPHAMAMTIAMSDCPNRKACDRCHAQKLSCKRYGDEACERCLRLRTECKSSPSLRYRKQHTAVESLVLEETTGPSGSSTALLLEGGRSPKRKRTESENLPVPPDFGESANVFHCV